MSPIFFALTVACAPPEAPSELEDLTGYLFSHVRDEDPAYLEAGVVSLDLWMEDRLEESLEGYTVNVLDQESVDALDEREQSLDGLVGAAVGGAFTHSMEDVVASLVADPATEMYDSFSLYEREYKTDLDCFLDGSCDWLEINVTSVSDYAMGLEVSVNFDAEYRRIQTDIGPAIVQRTWLTAPADVSFDWLGVEGQYFLCVFLDDGSTSRRMQATWIAAQMGESEVPEGTALSLVVSSMQESDEEVQAWLDEK